MIQQLTLYIFSAVYSFLYNNLTNLYIYVKITRYKVHNTNYVSKFAVWEEILRKKQQKKTTTKNKGKLVQLILDSSKFQILFEKPEYLRIVKATTEMCHNLHVARLLKMNI